MTSGSRHTIAARRTVGHHCRMRGSDVDAFVALNADHTGSEAPFSYDEWLAKLGARARSQTLCACRIQFWLTIVFH